MGRDCYIKLKNILLFVFLVGIFYLLQLKFLNYFWFDTDECDIMINGKGIARGFYLYKDLVSQHMPISYYLSAFFSLLGANTVTLQRIYFYLFFAFMWTIIVFRYSRVVGKKILIVYPFVHLCMIQNFLDGYGTQILSEHLAGIGAIILVLEFLQFSKNHNLSISSCVMISIAVLLTFGTIFVAIFALLYMGIGVIMLELSWQKKEKKEIISWIKEILFKYGRIVGIVAIPWIILVAYYISIGTLREFYVGAYSMNREIYPKYVGFGSNVMGTILQPVQNFFAFFSDFVNGQFNYSVLLSCVLIVLSVVFVYEMFDRKMAIQGITIFLFAYALGVRGLFNFHATASVEVLAFMATYVIFSCMIKDKDAFMKMPVVRKVAVTLLCVFIASGYMCNFTALMDITYTEEANQESQIIREITDYDEGVWQVSFGNGVLMRADRTSIGSAIVTPWTWEAFGGLMREQIYNNPPRVAYYIPDFAVWGHIQREWAPDTVAFIEMNYTLMPGTTYVYVYNDYYQEAYGKVYY